METNSNINKAELPSLSDKTILLVDDEESIRKFTSKVLEKYLNANVVACSNPKEAFDYLNTNIPDLVIMDLQMPMMDGLTALKYIRNSEKTFDLPVIICSALGFESVLMTTAKLGVSDFIVKPADVNTLIKKVLKALNMAT
ncbi:hypothetical protein MASR1M45_16380 [Candidatus Kapaibacterium sp.]